MAEQPESIDEATWARVVDTETTGVTKDDAVCEIGFCDLRKIDGIWQPQTPQSMLIDPGRPIPPEASAIHHITDDMVAGAFPLDVALSGSDMLDELCPVIIGHKLDFDRMFLELGDRPTICTYKCALRLAPNAPRHSNQVLRYWLDLDLDRALTEPPHRAGPDTYVTAHLAARMLNARKEGMPVNPLSKLIQLTAEPYILPRFTFGKHAMWPLADVPSSYLRWCLDTPDMDKEVHDTARHHLALRGEQAPTAGMEQV